ncbi:MAG: hypothetical protein FWG84_00930 [Bacteroidales bacterium]|nr:hypothetical protein [Bacteroidales bacterium]
MTSKKTDCSIVASVFNEEESVMMFYKFINSISSFSKVPLQLGIFTGLIFSAISLILIVFSLVMWILEKTIPGYTTLIIFMSAFAGIQLFVTGLIGQYISYVFDEVKGRPPYIVDEVYGGENEKNN